MRGEIHSATEFRVATDDRHIKRNLPMGNLMIIGFPIDTTGQLPDDKVGYFTPAKIEGDVMTTVSGDEWKLVTSDYDIPEALL